MKKIIAPTDFSSASYNACLYAAKMAEDLKAELILMHVMELPVAVAEYPVSNDVYAGLAMQKELEGLENNLRAATNNSIHIEPKNILGFVDNEIKELCNEEQPFAVVMGTHSYDMLDRFFIGSTTLHTVKNVRCPVLVIPSDVTYKPIKKIALAADLKNIYELPVQEIETIVNIFNAGLDVFYIGKDHRQISSRTLSKMLLDNRLINLEHAFHIEESPDILAGIKRLAKLHNTDLLMIVPRKHGLFYKSRSKDFIFYADVPVMALHEDDVPTQA
ncbi:universal stress protein [Parafilimonas sp.]|uniref:universal stress protein n=1 Tax=Parafilimonas sp. TaxID=1969739 RepID=UPI0039E36221